MNSRLVIYGEVHFRLVPVSAKRASINLIPAVAAKEAAKFVVLPYCQ